VEFYDVDDDVVEYKKAGGFLHNTSWLGEIDQIKDGSQNFIHSLDILYFWIEFRVDVQYSGYVIIAISRPLFLFVF
jgi:hypothetical protein